MTTTAAEKKVAILVDCENLEPEILEYAFTAIAKYGQPVIRRGYGNGATLANKWQAALVRHACTPCLQFPYAKGKNTADIALALDAQELLFDGRADTFCIVTSDSDFSYLSQKLRERGATIYIVGEVKTPAPLRNAADKFFEWPQTAPTPKPTPQLMPVPTVVTLPANQTKAKTRPGFVIKAVEILGAESIDGRVSLSTLGSYLSVEHPGFATKNYGHKTLGKMLETYDLLTLITEANGHMTVKRADKAA